MVRQLSRSLSSWVRPESHSAASRLIASTSSVGRLVVPTRSFSALAARPSRSPTSPSPLASGSLSSSSTPSQLHSRSFASSSLLDASFKASLPALAGRKPAGKGPKSPLNEEGEVEEHTSEEAAKEIAEAAKKGTPAAPRSAPGVVATSAANGSAAGADAREGAAAPPSSDGSDDPASGGLTKRVVPDFYPQVLALPITRRPLFPGFYKAVVIRNPAVVAAIKEAVKRGQPYIGAFLLKDENADSDM